MEKNNLYRFTSYFLIIIAICSYFLGFSQKPVENVNLVLGSILFGLQILCFGFLADLVTKMSRNIMQLIEETLNRGFSSLILTNAMRPMMKKYKD